MPCRSQWRCCTELLYYSNSPTALSTDGSVSSEVLLAHELAQGHEATDTPGRRAPADAESDGRMNEVKAFDFQHAATTCGGDPSGLRRRKCPPTPPPSGSLTHTATRGPASSNGRGRRTT